MWRLTGFTKAVGWSEAQSEVHVCAWRNSAAAGHPRGYGLLKLGTGSPSERGTTQYTTKISHDNAMPNVISSVRITPNAYHLLNRLSGKLQRPKAQVIEEALEILEEHVFWREVQDAFASGEPEEMRPERELWDSATKEGLAQDRL